MANQTPASQTIRNVKNDLLDARYQYTARFGYTDRAKAFDELIDALGGDLLVALKREEKTARIKSNMKKVE